MIENMAKWVNYLIAKEKSHQEEINALKEKIKDMEEKQHILGKSILKVIGPAKKKRKK